MTETAVFGELWGDLQYRLRASCVVMSKQALDDELTTYSFTSRAGRQSLAQVWRGEASRPARATFGALDQKSEDTRHTRLLEDLWRNSS